MTRGRVTLKNVIRHYGTYQTQGKWRYWSRGRGGGEGVMGGSVD